MRASPSRSLLVLLTTAILVAGCGTAAPRTAPTQTPASTVPSIAPSPLPASSLIPTPAPSPGDPFLGQVVVTVSDRLRVRSQPWVGDDSIRYEPLLPLYTKLVVLDGPVEGSGYVWYQVEPADFTLDDGPGYGWVAMAGRDGEPWIARPGEAIRGPAASAEPDIAGIELAKASVPRATADPAAARTAAASINAFGLDLLRAILADPKLELADKNAVFSPASIVLALAMARAGAKGDTAAEMDKVLHTSGWDELGPGLNALEQVLASRNATWEDEGLDPPTRGVALRIANAAFAQRDWEIEQAYLEQIGRTFGAGMRLVDYRTDLEAARKLINAWVSEQTKERIPELIPPLGLNELTRLVLVNAIYLKAAWAQEFSTGATEPRPFTRLDGSRTKVETMFQSGGQEIPYAQGNGWQAAELRYEAPVTYTSDGESSVSRPLAMTLILPDDLAAFEERLSATQLERIATALEGERERLTKEETWDEWDSGGPCQCGCYPYSADLYLPRFSVETKAGLADLLKSLGMQLAFTKATAESFDTSFAKGYADFYNIHVPKRWQEVLYIQNVIHQANIDVDEKGTEASAATAVFMGETGGGCVGTAPTPLRTITLRLDSPFLFVLRDVETGAVLFMGRVVDPSVGR